MVDRLVPADSVTGRVPDFVKIAGVNIDSSATADPADMAAGTATDKIVTPGNLPFVTIKPSGDTTGVTDSALISAASVAGRQFRLGVGTIYVAGDVPVESFQHWQGAGKDKTTLFVVNGSNPTATFEAPTGLFGVTISDLTIDGNKAGNTTGHGVSILDGTDCTVDRCRIKNTPTVGIYATGTDLSITDNDLFDIGDTDTETGTHCAIGVSTVGTKITGNHIKGCSDSGIICIGDGSNVIANNIIEDCYFIGIGLGAGHAIGTGGPHVIDGNTVKTTGGNSIDTGTACNVSVTGNTCIDGFTGIDIDISSHARAICNIAITGNTIRDMAASGIELIGNQTNGHSGFTIADNTITETGFHGIHVSAMHDGTIASNHIADVSASAAGFSFIRLVAATPGCVDLTVTGNVLNDDAARTSWGISSSGTANDFITFAHNDLRNCAVKLDGTFGAGCIFDGNMPRVRETMWIPTSKIDPFVGAAIGSIQFTAAWMFDQTTLEYVRTNVEFPVGWANASLDIHWSQEAAGAGNVLWFCNNEHCATGGSLTATGTAWAFVVEAAPAQRVTKVTSSTNIVPVTPGHFYNVWFGRNAPDASDTLANDAGIIGVMLRETS